MLGLAALAVTTSASAAGTGTSATNQPAGPDRAADSTVLAQFSAAKTPTPQAAAADVPALEVGATPLGARRPVELDGRRASDTGTLPGTAAYAYTFASSALEEAEPNCGLRWSLLAAIGRIESNHGRAGEARLEDQGVVAPAVRGVRLDGSSGTSAVRDTDAGDLDGNRRFDRAVGPMQLLPSTWGVVGVDADGDGKRNPDDIDDAALGAAVLLCGAPGRLSTDAGLAEALERYNAAPGYATAVADLEQQYRSSGVPVATLRGSTAAVELAPSTPSATLEAMIAGDDDEVDSLDLPSLRTGGRDDKDGKDRKNGKDKGSKQDDARDNGRNSGPDRDGGKGDGNGKGDGKGGEQPTDPPNEPGNPPNEPTDPPNEPSDPPNEPSDPPNEPNEPTDPPNEPTEPPAPACSDTPAGAAPPSQPSSPVAAAGGVLSCDAGGWYVGGRSVLVGDAAWLSTSALANFDGDGAVESNLEELRGLVGATVTAQVDNAGTVWTLQGQPYLPVAVPTPSRTPNATPTGGASPSGSGGASGGASPSGSGSAGPSGTASP